MLLQTGHVVHMVNILCKDAGELELYMETMRNDKSSLVYHAMVAMVTYGLESRIPRESVCIY